VRDFCSGAYSWSFPNCCGVPVSFGIDQDVSDVLDIADFPLAAANLE
jgi:hypothetical protein